MIEVEKSFREKTLRVMGILRLHLSLELCFSFLLFPPPKENVRFDETCRKFSPRRRPRST